MVGWIKCYEKGFFGDMCGPCGNYSNCRNRNEEKKLLDEPSCSECKYDLGGCYYQVGPCNGRVKFKPKEPLGVSELDVDLFDKDTAYEPNEKVFQDEFQYEDNKGMKDDDGKLRWDLLPWDAVEKIVEIMTYGAKKYSPNNWQKVLKNRYQAAMMRHFVAEWKGEDDDRESELLHLAHMACNALFLLWKKINEVD